MAGKKNVLWYGMMYRLLRICTCFISFMFISSTRTDKQTQMWILTDRTSSGTNCGTQTKQSITVYVIFPETGNFKNKTEALCERNNKLIHGQHKPTLMHILKSVKGHQDESPPTIILYWNRSCLPTKCYGKRNASLSHDVSNPKNGTGHTYGLWSHVAGSRHCSPVPGNQRQRRRSSGRMQFAPSHPCLTAQRQQCRHSRQPDQRRIHRKKCDAESWRWFKLIIGCSYYF